MTAFTNLSRYDRFRVLNTIERLAVVTNASFWMESDRRNKERERLCAAKERLAKYVIEGENRWNY